MHDAIHKYEEWTRELERRRLGLIASRKHLRWLLVACAAATAVTLHWGAFAALCMAGFWLTLFATGLYIASMYDWDYLRQIQAAEDELAKLRDGTGDAMSQHVPGDVTPPPDAFRDRRITRKLTWGFRDRT